MTDNSMGRSIRQTWRALRHERLMSRPARRDRRVQREACDQGVSQQRELVRPHSLVLSRFNIPAHNSPTESDRESGVVGKGWLVRVGHGCRLTIKKKKKLRNSLLQE